MSHKVAFLTLLPLFPYGPLHELHGLAKWAEQSARFAYFTQITLISLLCQVEKVRILKKVVKTAFLVEKRRELIKIPDNFFLPCLFQPLSGTEFLAQRAFITEEIHEPRQKRQQTAQAGFCPFFIVVVKGKVGIFPREAIPVVAIASSDAQSSCRFGKIPGRIQSQGDSGSQTIDEPMI